MAICAPKTKNTKYCSPSASISNFYFNPQIRRSFLEGHSPDSIPSYNNHPIPPSKFLHPLGQITIEIISMRIISCPPSFFFGSSKKKSRRDSTPSLTSNSASSPSDDQTTTPKSVLSPKPRRREEQSSSSSFEAASGATEGENTKVTRRELEIVLRRLQPKPPTEEEVAEMLAEADRRGDGQFSVEEIAALGFDTGGPASPDLRETFAVFDGDGDGKISAEELRGVFAALGDELCTLENCRRMIGVVDTDGDGFVCFDEFVRMMRGQR